MLISKTFKGIKNFKELQLNNIKKSKKGFTLLELVISIGLVALFIIPIGNMVLGSVKINKSGENKQQANILLQETLENIKAVKEYPSTIVEEGKFEEELSVGYYAKLNNGAIIKLISEIDGKKRYEVLKKENEFGISLKGTIEGEEIVNSVYVPGTSNKEDNIEDYYSKVDLVIRILEKNIICEKYDETGKLISSMSIEDKSKLDIKESGAGNKGQIFINGQKFEHHDFRAYLIVVENNRKVNITLTKEKNDNSDKNRIDFYVHEKYKTGSQSTEALKLIFNFNVTNNPVHYVGSTDEGSGEGSEVIDTGTWINNSIGKFQYSVDLKATKKNKLLDSLTTKIVN